MSVLCPLAPLLTSDLISEARSFPPWSFLVQLLHTVVCRPTRHVATPAAWSTVTKLKDGQTRLAAKYNLALTFQDNRIQ
jgi:hypothetical protein